MFCLDLPFTVPDVECFGDGEGTRTLDVRPDKPMLLPLSYAAIYLEPTEGIKPSTYRLQGGCSIN
jgi:hypothetical protein